MPRRRPRPAEGSEGSAPLFRAGRARGRATHLAAGIHGRAPPETVATPGARATMGGRAALSGSGSCPGPETPTATPTPTPIAWPPARWRASSQAHDLHACRGYLQLLGGELAGGSVYRTPAIGCCSPCVCWGGQTLRGGAWGTSGAGLRGEGGRGPGGGRRRFGPGLRSGFRSP